MASFLESTVVPIPYESIMIPVVLADRTRAWRVAASALAGCLLGALAGYLVGGLLYETLGRWLLETYGYGDAFQQARGRFQEEGSWFLFVVGISPIPLQIGTIGAGLSGYPLLPFLLLMALARGLRYFGLALLLWLLGDWLVSFLRSHGRAVHIAVWFLAAILAAHAVWQMIA